MQRVDPSALSRGLLAVLLGSLAFVPASASAQASGPAVVVVEVDGSIDRTLVSYLIDQVAEAERTGATVVLQLDTAGTLDQDAVALAERVHDATVPVVAWVGPAPAKAAGAGLLLLYASSLGAVAPGVGVGPLEPVDLAYPDGGPSAAELEALVATWTSERGRPAAAPIGDGPVPAQDAIEAGAASVAAASIPGLLGEIDGMTVRTASGEQVLRTRVATEPGQEPVDVRFTELGPIDRVLHAAASPTWIYVLLVLGLAGLAFELTQPGFGFAGFAGVGLLALGGYGLVVVPFSPLGLGLLLGGVGLLTADVRLRRLGLLTATGMVAFVAGSILVFAGVADAIDVSPWLIGSTAVAVLLFWGFGLTVAVQSRERLTSTQRGLVGLLGEARGDLEPDGPVFVKGTLWRGKSANGPIPAGTRIRVRGVDGLILQVTPDPSEPPEPGPAPGDPA